MTTEKQLKNQPHEYTVAFIVARLDSSRFPGKHFQTIGDRPLIQWIVDRLKTSREINEIVLTTAAAPSNLPLRNWACQQKISCFWYKGDVNQVTTRLSEAAQKYGASICILISGDCPLLHTPTIDSLIRNFKQHPNANVLSLLPPPEGKRSALEGLCIARQEAWKIADQHSRSPEQKEHHFPVINEQPELFSFLSLPHPLGLYGDIFRLSVDTYADICFFNRLYEELSRQRLPFELPQVLNLLRSKPDIVHINSHVHQRGINEQVYSVLFFLDAGGDFGFGHLMRSRELALQITERLSWPVLFVIDNHYTAKLLEERGFNFIWGAFSRVAKKNTLQLPEVTEKHFKQADILLLDLADRTVNQGWQNYLPDKLPVMVIDKATEWAQHADTIVIPGVTDSKCITRQNTSKQDSPTLFCGSDYIILRREVREVSERDNDKYIDILAYLHHENDAVTLTKLCKKHSLTLHIVDGQNTNFPQLLAKSKFYLANFGYSFYEALYLHSFPICLPLTKTHGRDAALFYKKFGLPEYIIDESCPFSKLIEEIAHASVQHEYPHVEDGTQRIVQLIKNTVLNESI